MANENELAIAYTSGETLKAIVWGKDRSTRWNGTVMVDPSMITDAAWATGMVTMTEKLTSDGTSTGMYVGDLPITEIDGEHQIDYVVGASPTPGQSRIGWQAVGAVTTDSASRDASKADISTLATASGVDDLQAHGDMYWPTATGFATPGDEMNLTSDYNAAKYAVASGDMTTVQSVADKLQDMIEAV